MEPGAESCRENGGEGLRAAVCCCSPWNPRSMIADHRGDRADGSDFAPVDNPETRVRRGEAVVGVFEANSACHSKTTASQCEPRLVQRLVTYPRFIDHPLHAILHGRVRLVLIASAQLGVAPLDHDLHEAPVRCTDGIALFSTGPDDRDTATVAAADLGLG